MVQDFSSTSAKIHPKLLKKKNSYNIPAVKRVIIFKRRP